MQEKRFQERASSRIASRNKFRHQMLVGFRIFLLLCFISFLIFFLRTEKLQIQNVEVFGVVESEAREVRLAALAFLAKPKLAIVPGTHTLFINEDALAKYLKQKSQSIEQLEVSTEIWNRKVQISLLEYSADFLWCRGEAECFNMTKDGLVFERSSESGGKLIFKGLLEGEPVSQKFATPERMREFAEIATLLASKNMSVSLIEIVSLHKGVMKTLGCDIVFDPEGKIVEQVKNAITVIEDLALHGEADVEYVDARFGNKVFYK